jgi:hypothetical protein
LMILRPDQFHCGRAFCSGAPCSELLSAEPEWSGLVYLRCKSQSRNPCNGEGRSVGYESAAIEPLPLPVSDSCLRRIFRWRVPPNWSVSDWRKEMRAEAACAAWEAVRDYDPSLGVPLGAFAHQRVLTRTLTRYRQEWAYALRLAPEYDSESSSGSRLLDSAVSAMFDRCPRQALSGLSKAQFWLAEQLFLKDRTEADIAAQIGITQQAINKRKRAIVIELRRYIDRTILSGWAACLLPVFCSE